MLNKPTMLNFSERSELVKTATRPGRGGFYRKLYGLTGTAALTIPSQEEWLKLPPVTKDSLLAMPLAERSFLPLQQLDHLRASSGTAGKPPLFSPRTHVRNMEYRLRYHDFKGAFLAFTVPLMPHWHEYFLKEHGREPRVVVYDPRAPRTCARLAKAAGVDALSIFVFHAIPLGEALKAEGAADAIRLVEITGEVASQSVLEYLEETFPNATILQSYGASEVEDVHMGMPCRPVSAAQPTPHYHPKKTHYLEILDPETGKILEPEEGVEGELLVTAYPGEPSAFPLIRFRIGDRVRVMESTCAAHGSWTFTVLGRAEMDFIKVLGGVLRADEVTRVLRLARDSVSDRFELHHYMEVTPDGPKTRVVLRVETRGKTVDLDALAVFIAQQLRVGPARTYAQGTSTGAYLPLQCEAVETFGDAKTKRFIRH
jgi:phenylacetate-coenzyme A ligase PaaK-like adenylate-forming protein